VSFGVLNIYEVGQLVIVTVLLQVGLQFTIASVLVIWEQDVGYFTICWYN